MNGCTDPTPYGEGCDRDLCTNPVGGEHVATCEPSDGDVVRVVNPDSCFHTLTGLVVRTVERTAMIQFERTGFLPFGFSELRIERVAR